MKQMWFLDNQDDDVPASVKAELDDMQQSCEWGNYEAHIIGFDYWEVDLYPETEKYVRSFTQDKAIIIYYWW
jgi:hypothetical protein